MKECGYSSRFPKFYDKSIAERRMLLADCLSKDDFAVLDQGLSLQHANIISENVIGNFSLPLSVATNFIVDKKPVLVPMVTEEPSIVAASSKMAKIVAKNGGFTTEVDSPYLKGQVQIYAIPDIDAAVCMIEQRKEELMDYANLFCTSMKQRGGGVSSLTCRVIRGETCGPMLIVDILVNVADAMGANKVNTIVESLAKKLHALVGGSLGISILSNLCDQRMATSQCVIDYHALASDSCGDNGEANAKKILFAHEFAQADIYRACTHNKGILNGIDAVLLATGNDFRAVEAAAHTHASISGRYSPLTKIELDGNKKQLRAELALPLALGVVGGLTKYHSAVKLSHKLLGEFSETGKKLSSVVVSVGLAQCLAALFALSTHGIQRGHMKLHYKKIN